jgi:hypothetical protein
MTEKLSTTAKDQEMDQILRNVFPATPPLSEEFENRVIREISSTGQKRRGHRKVTLLMAIYWGFATAFAASLLAGYTVTSDMVNFSFMSTTIITVGSILALAWFVVKQSQVHLADLFARTLL